MLQPFGLHVHALDQLLPMRLRTKHRLSDDAFFELCARNRELRIERTAEGEIIVMSPAGSETGKRNAALLIEIGIWARRDGTGVVFDSSTGFILSNGAERAPDVSWVRRERWDALTREQKRKFAPLCPDFVLELMSPSDDLEEVKAKMEEYIACGARLGWLVDADEKRVFVYRPGRAVEALAGAKELSGDPELPGLVVDLSALD